MFKHIAILYSYFKERFPFGLLLLFCLLTVSGVEKYLTGAATINSFLLAFLFTLLLLHIRFLDEFKDFSYDSKNYKDRPVQKGTINFKQLRLYIIINSILMFAMALYLKGFIFIFLLTYLYTLLMLKEFFIKNLYVKSPLGYLVSHEVLFLILYAYVFSFFRNKFTHLFTDPKIFLLTIYVFTPILLIELGRKIKHRKNYKGQNTNDTYAYLWGEEKALLIFLVMVTANFLFISLLFGHNFLWFLFLLQIFLTIMGCHFFRRILIRNNMVPTVFYSLIFPALLIIL